MSIRRQRCGIFVGVISIFLSAPVLAQTGPAVPQTNPQAGGTADQFLVDQQKQIAQCIEENSALGAKFANAICGLSSPVERGDPVAVQPPFRHDTPYDQFELFHVNPQNFEQQS